MKKLFLAALLALPLGRAAAQAPKQDKLLYGVAYYEEYLPYDRLDQDIRMMQAAGINVVRIAESTWNTLEPQEGVFDYSHVDRVLNAMHKAGIRVIIGTPTYAVPTWLARKYPAVLATTARGPNQYGVRQNMDISNPDFRRHAEAVIRAMLAHAFPLITKTGLNQRRKTVHYYFNYSAAPGTVRYPHGAGQELLAGAAVAKGQSLQLAPWGVQIVEER